MKKLLILLFSILISFNSYGEWLKIGDSEKNGNTYFIDKDTIKKNGEYVYWYHMSNYKKLNEYGDMSEIIYYQGDCGMSKYKMLSGIFYYQLMGTNESSRETAKNPEWVYTFPGQIDKALLEYACNNAN